MNSLYNISNDLRNIYDRIDNGDGIDIETGEIKPEIMKALAITQENLQSKAIDYGYVIKTFDDELGLYDKEIKRLQEKRKQIANIQERLKTNLLNAMEKFNIVEISGKTIKLSLRKSDKVEVYDIDLLGDEYKTVKTEPNKVAIKRDIKNGKEIEGAKLVECQNLQIK